MVKFSKPGLYHLGVITRAQGTRGGFLMELADPEIVTDQLEIIYICYPEQQWTPYRTEEMRVHQNRNRNLFFVKLEGIDSRTEAEQLRGHNVMSDEHFVPSDVENTAIGYEVVRDDNSVIGEVTEMFDTPAYSVIVVAAGEKQVLIPWVDRFVVNVCTNSERIIVRNTSELESLD